MMFLKRYDFEPTHKISILTARLTTTKMDRLDRQSQKQLHQDTMGHYWK